MIKKYSQWITEDIEISKEVESPTKIELVTGNIITYIDPQEESWQSQITNLKDYQELLKEIKFAVSEDDAKRISQGIEKAKATALFSKEPSTVWNRDQIEQQEPMRSDVDFDRWVARYIENKLGSFIAWAENKK